MMVSHRAVDQLHSWDSSINMSPPDQHMDESQLLNWSNAVWDTIMDCQVWCAQLSVSHLVTRRPSRSAPYCCVPERWGFHILIQDLRMENFNLLIGQGAKAFRRVLPHPSTAECTGDATPLGRDNKNIIFSYGGVDFLVFHCYLHLNRVLWISVDMDNFIHADSLSYLPTGLSQCKILICLNLDLKNFVNYLVWKRLHICYELRMKKCTQKQFKHPYEGHDHHYLHADYLPKRDCIS